MKQITLTLVLLLFSISLLSQRTTYKIDTVYKEKDSVIVFVQVFLDSNLRSSYYGTFDSLDLKFHYGFLWLKEGIWREYYIKRKWGCKEFQLITSMRMEDGQPVIRKRIK